MLSVSRPPPKRRVIEYEVGRPCEPQYAAYARGSAYSRERPAQLVDPEGSCSSDPEILAEAATVPIRTPLADGHHSKRPSPLRESASADAVMLLGDSAPHSLAHPSSPLLTGSLVDLHKPNGRRDLTVSASSALVPRSHSVCADFSASYASLPNPFLVAPPAQLPLLVKEFPLRDATPEVSHREAVMLDVPSQLFGLRTLYNKLAANIVDSKNMSIVYRDGDSVSVQRVFYSQAPDGSGVRTLTYNFCSQNRINLLIVKAPAIHAEYKLGTYARIVERAAALAPCLVLIDRLDYHWDRACFRTIGSELLSAWDGLREMRLSMNERVPDAWFLISNSTPLAECHIDVFKAMYHNLCVAEALSSYECVTVLAQVYAVCMLETGAMVDDRPAPLPTNPRPSARQEDQHKAALNKCEYTRETMKRADLFNQIGQLLHRSAAQHTVTDEKNNTHPMPMSVRPEWLADIVKRAFVAARERYSCERRNRGVASAQNPADTVPTDADFFNLVRSMPFSFKLPDNALPW